MTSLELFKVLEQAAFSIAKKENLPLKEISRNPARVNVVGLCIPSEGKIFIRMPSSKYMSPKVKMEEAGRTIAHELAHFKYPNHRIEFWIYSSLLCMKLSSELGMYIPPEKVCISKD